MSARPRDLPTFVRSARRGRDRDARLAARRPGPGPGRSRRASRSTSPALAPPCRSGARSGGRPRHRRGHANFDRYAATYERYVRLRDTRPTWRRPSSASRPRCCATRGRSAISTSRHALLAAMTQLGVPYRSHRSEPGVGFDCSGLTSYAWGVAGEDLPRQSRVADQRVAARRAVCRQAGDLMYYPGHVMMFLGIGDAMVHSPQRGSEVEITFLSERHAENVTFADPTPPSPTSSRRPSPSCRASGRSTRPADAVDALTPVRCIGRGRREGWVRAGRCGWR